MIVIRVVVMRVDRIFTGNFLVALLIPYISQASVV